MKFRLHNVWCEIDKEIEINTLEELLALCKEYKHSIIVSEGDLEIYDTYRE